MAEHDALIAAYVRKLEASTTGLIDTYPGEAYPTDVTAVAGAIAVHGRVTGEDHSAVLARWARGVREVQTDPASGLVIQRLDARTGFALAPLRAFGHPDAFTRVYRTADLFGLPVDGERFHFRTGGPIGNALLFAFLTSGPEVAP